MFFVKRKSLMWKLTTSTLSVSDTKCPLVSVNDSLNKGDGEIEHMKVPYLVSVALQH